MPCCWNYNYNKTHGSNCKESALTVSPQKYIELSPRAAVAPGPFSPKCLLIDAWSNNYFINDIVDITAFHKMPGSLDQPLTVEPTITIGVITLGGGLFGKLTAGVLTQGDVQEFWYIYGIGNISGTPIASPPTGQSGVTYTGQPIVKIVTVGATNSPSMSDNQATANNTIVVETIGLCVQGFNNPSKLTIVLYIGTNSLNSLRDLINTAANDNTNNPSVLCIPWGAPETILTPSSTITTETLKTPSNPGTVSGALKAANLKGITICTASGINGSTNGTLVNSVDFPASSPYSTTVGANSMSRDGVEETVWPFSGGGISDFFPRPFYQTGRIGLVSTNTYRRSIPDISMPGENIIFYLNSGRKKPADSITGVYIYSGTSISAALAAAFFGICNKKIFVNPKLYSATATDQGPPFVDIIKGSMSISGVSQNKASVGYDKCTGLGSIIGTILSTKLS